VFSPNTAAPSQEPEPFLRPGHATGHRRDQAQQLAGSQQSFQPQDLLLHQSLFVNTRFAKSAAFKAARGWCVDLPKGSWRNAQADKCGPFRSQTKSSPTSRLFTDFAMPVGFVPLPSPFQRADSCPVFVLGQQRCSKVFHSSCRRWSRPSYSAPLTELYLLPLQIVHDCKTLGIHPTFFVWFCFKCKEMECNAIESECKEAMILTYQNWDPCQSKHLFTWGKYVRFLILFLIKCFHN